MSADNVRNNPQGLGPSGCVNHDGKAPAVRKGRVSERGDIWLQSGGQKRICLLVQEEDFRCRCCHVEPGVWESSFGWFGK